MKDQENAYKAAGVDIDEGNRLVEQIGKHVKKTNRSGVMSGLGGFGACFDLNETGYKDPVLVSATDGVGTKLRIAIECNSYDSIGIDLVAMCVNDLIVQGAEPLFFLDYFACAKLDADMATEVVAGIANGCVEANCALIGGETAEMPGMYNHGDFDLAGFCVGAVERNAIISGQGIQEGDIILGLASSGLHSNGFSLVRKILEDNRLSYAENFPLNTDKSIGETLLEPTKIYVRSLLEVFRSEARVKGIAHITGGGLLENIPRILPSGLCVKLDARKWSCPSVIKWLAQEGNLQPLDAARTLNCGIGMVLICAAEYSDRIIRVLEHAHEKVYKIGTVEAARDEASSLVGIENLDVLWDELT